MADARTDGERIASVEADVRSIKEMLLTLNGKLDAWSQSYVPRQEINEMFRSRDKDIDQLKDDKRNNKALIPSWVAVVIAAAALLYSIWPH